MAFQSHVLENGQWVTRTNNINDLLNSRAAVAKPATERHHGPQCGIMTRTVAQSPVAHWILPVRLRSSQHNDIAFVGVCDCPLGRLYNCHLGLPWLWLTRHRTTTFRYQNSAGTASFTPSTGNVTSAHVSGTQRLSAQVASWSTARSMLLPNLSTTMT